MRLRDVMRAGATAALIQNVTPSAAHAALPADFRHAVPRRLQRQSVPHGDGACWSSTASTATRRRKRRSAPSPAACSSCPSSCFRRSSGQLADAHDKARIVRIVKTAEILHHDRRRGRPAARTTSRCCSPRCSRWASTRPSSARSNMRSCRSISSKDEVLGGTGLVEAGTYIAILGGTILGGVLVLQRPDGSYHAEWAALGVLLVALIGRVAGQFVPPGPARRPEIPAIRIADGLAHRPRLDHAWSAPRCTSRGCSWRSSRSASSGRWARCWPRSSRRWSRMRSAPTRPSRPCSSRIFSVGVAIGSVAVNRLLKGQVSARFAPASALLMGLFVARPLSPRARLASARRRAPRHRRPSSPSPTAG